MIPYGCQNITDEEISAVVEVLKSDYLTQGPKVTEFEKAIACRTQVEFVTALSNGTAALHVACLAMGLSSGDLLWTSPISFVASANCGLYCGAQVDFVDIDAQTRNMSIVELEKKLVVAKQNDRLPKVLVVVHFAGVPCNMKAISKLSKLYGFYVIEDAAHAMGSEYEQATVGSCQYSDLTIFSFHPVKNMTSGEGGAICTNDSRLNMKVRMLMNHGVVRDKNRLENKDSQFWYYEQQCLGFNYRLTDIQAAIGIVQLRRLDSFVERRRYLANRYRSLLGVEGLKLPIHPSGTKPAWHIYVVEMRDSNRRDQVAEALFLNGVSSNLHYIPIHLQPYYKNLGFKQGDYPVAEHYYRNALTIPLYPGLSDEDQNRIAHIICEAL